MKCCNISAARAAPCASRCAIVSPRAASGRREMILSSVNFAVLGALFNIGAAPRPSNIGVTSGKQLNLCPSTPNCISTAEELNDPAHYVPAWNYNPQDGRALKNPATQAQAMDELVAVVTELKPDNFTPTIITQTSDYLYVEYESPTFGFIDDVEFYFKGDVCEYRSASRIGESDGNANRKRIAAIRKELQKKGWESVGF